MKNDDNNKVLWTELVHSVQIIPTNMVAVSIWWEDDLKLNTEIIPGIAFEVKVSSSFYYNWDKRYKFPSLHYSSVREFQDAGWVFDGRGIHRRLLYIGYYGIEESDDETCSNQVIYLAMSKEDAESKMNSFHKQARDTAETMARAKKIS